ncbi:hypothetical protein EGT07_02305 [Herbaspirillum sp. HC18]|nr:hypothetical protein EGT07_02305 [Herbaspirillum sp. HC18]
MRYLIAFFASLTLLCATSASRAEDLPREVVINGVEFVHVPQGWFWYAIGGGYWKDIKTKKSPWYRDVKIWLDGFYIGKYEALGSDLLALLQSGKSQYAWQYASGEARGCAVRRRPDGEYYLADPARKLPATHMSWQLADELARWMGFRVPTEAEWVKAARGTDRRVWPWGDEYPDDTFAGYGSGPDCHPLPIDYHRNGVSPYGAYNMAGNALEFVADWFNEDWDVSLKDGQRNPPLAANGTLMNNEWEAPMKLLKGGRWGSNADYIHIYARRPRIPEGNFICFGVRYAVDEATVRAHLANGTAKVVMQGKP